MKPLPGDIDFCMQQVRNGDMDRYLSVLFAARNARAGLFALYAFNLEVASIRDMITEPVAGEIRLQWWRDTIAALFDGACPDHPVARLLGVTIAEKNLPAAAFSAMIDARRFDLYDDAPPDLAFLEGYAGETASALFALSSRILTGAAASGAATSAGYGGVAYALTGLMRAFSFHRARGQVYLPCDQLERNGVTPQAVLADEEREAVSATLAGLRNTTRRHLDLARKSAGEIPPEARSAFLPLTLVEPCLNLMDVPAYDPYRDRAELSHLARQWRYWRAAWRGSF